MLKNTLTSMLLGAAVVGAAILGGASGDTFAATELRLNGSATVVKNIMTPNKNEIESASGISLALVANGSGNGLKDLYAGKSDMAMISAPIQVEADIANGKQPGSLDITGFEVFPIGHTKIFFIIHPSNPVKSLTADQMRDVLSGKITNWNELGGPNSPITVFAEKPGNGTRAVVESVFVQGGTITSKARLVPALAQVAKIISQSPNAVGYGNNSSITSSVSTIQGLEVLQPLSLVSKGAPTPDPPT